MSLGTYARLYDEVVIAMEKMQPDMKFVGMAPAARVEPHHFEYFLDAKNHKPREPLDFIPYHSVQRAGRTQTSTPTSIKTPNFLKTVHFIEDTHKLLSPSMKTTVDELGVISADDGSQGDSAHITKPIPALETNWGTMSCQVQRPPIYNMAFVTPEGKRRLLLVNKRNRRFDIGVPGAARGQVVSVDQTTGFKSPASAGLSSDTIRLDGFSVAVVTLP